MKKQTRRLIMGLLLLLVVVLSGFTYAYWANIQNSKIEDQTIQIGSGRTTTVSVTLNGAEDGYHLVPVGQIDNSNEEDAVDNVDFTFNVVWTDTAEYSTMSILTITLEFEDLVVGGTTITAARLTEIFETELTFIPTITKDMPHEVSLNVLFLDGSATGTNLTPEEVAALQLAVITFNITFTVAQVPNP